MTSTYVHGHHSSVLDSHGARTAANSAAYLLPHLRAGMRLLDLGCGPGTITLDLAGTVGTDGRVVGVDSAEAALDAARRAAAERGDTTTVFQVGDAYALPFEDDSFDVAHAHQVMQHLANPVAALRELVRVVRPGGLVAFRDADYGSMSWHPGSDGLDRWLETYRRTARLAGGEPDAARHVLAWARAAGLTQIEPSTSTWSYATPDERAWWGGQWVERARHSAFATQAVDAGLATAADLEDFATAWAAWSQDPDAWFAMVHGEVVARVPER
ncbi:methyltransferase domain-containing protein [Ornithinimicrobium avium]|uniref:methyltransferase domain-containing protein n=1 Tax=Ornithinimicrobium avium TaxID=2283195 RepID=UPI001D182F4A|nr:methyltransferase domain-containing protein [Ornithinimicrobium avium]